LTGNGNVTNETTSAAEALYDLGSTLRHDKLCACDRCKTHDKFVRKNIQKDTIELAIQWFNYCDQHPGICFRALHDGWNEKQIKSELILAGLVKT
jgi:hypothetical protein